MKELREQDPALGRILPPGRIEPEKKYIPSRFAFPAEGVWFHLLTRQMVSLSREMPESISGAELLRDAERKKLAEGYFLVPEGKDETGFYLGIFQILHALIRKKGVRRYTILPTSACNARCVYCFEQGRRQVTMTPETLNRTVEFIRRTRADGEIGIRWFGGEPLLAADLIDSLCGRLREEGIPFASGITTNGSLLREELADRMRTRWNLKHAQVSMDGNEADYIARKRYLRETDAYHAALRGIRMLAERGIRVDVRCNVDEKNLEGIGDFLRDLAEAVPDRSGVDVSLSLLNQVREGGRAPEMTRRIAEMRPLLREYGFGLRDSRFTLGNLRNFHCMADLGDVVIDAEGGLYGCEHCVEESRIGDLREGTWEGERQEAFCGTRQVRPACQDCPFLPACTPFASCPVQDTRCRETKEFLLREQIRDYLARGRSGEEPAEEKAEC